MDIDETSRVGGSRFLGFRHLLEPQLLSALPESADAASNSASTIPLAVNPNIHVAVLSIQRGERSGVFQDTVEKQIEPLIEGRYPDGLEDLLQDLPGKLKTRPGYGAEYKVNILYSKNNVVLLEAVPLASKSENEYLLVTFSGNEFSDVRIEGFEQWRRDNLLGFDSPNVVSSDQINLEFQFSPLQPSEQYESTLDETLKQLATSRQQAEFEARRAMILEKLLRNAELERVAIANIGPQQSEKLKDFHQFVSGSEMILHKAGGRKNREGFTGGVVLAYRNYAAANANIINKYSESDDDSIEERIQDLCDAYDLRSTVIRFGDRSPVYTEQERLFLASRDHLKKTIEILHEAVEEHLVQKLGKIKLLINNNFKNSRGKSSVLLTTNDLLDITYEQCTQNYLHPRIEENISYLIRMVNELYNSRERIGYMTAKEEQDLFVTKKRVLPSVLDRICEIIWDPKYLHGLGINLEEVKRIKGY